jgi:hypothetical protein
MQVFFNDNWRSCSTNKVLASSKYCSSNLSSLIIITKLSTYLMKRIDVVFWVWQNRNLWPFLLIHVFLLKLVIMVYFLVITFSSNPFRVKFAINGLMALL